VLGCDVTKYIKQLPITVSRFVVKQSIKKKKQMKYIFKSVLVMGAILLASCSSQQSLQEYYVDNSENPNFISIDLPASILKMDAVDLNPTQKEAVESLRKFNLLAFKKDSDNALEFEAEKKKVREILKGDDFVELMKINSKYGKGVIKYLGDEDAIDEVIIYGDSDDKGFALVRVLGKDMNPAHIVQLMQAIQKSDYKGEGLGEIGDFLKG
jgi:hypothetical protein